MKFKMILVFVLMLVTGCTPIRQHREIQETITVLQDVPMGLVPAGAFSMGSDNGAIDRQPAHQVYLDDFYIDTYEVSNARYAGCVLAGKCKQPVNNIAFNDPNFADYPVVFVNFAMAEKYCLWRGARLPSEAEWEKAARGTDGRLYPWGSDWGFDCVPANFGGCNTSAKPIGSYPAGISPYGAYEMAGNVWEWVSDWYAQDYYSTLPVLSKNPSGPNTGEERVVRGGSWISFHEWLEIPSRSKFDPEYGIATIGFRCARSK